MSYSAEISRNNPSCFLFLIDQSGSMADAFASGEARRRKCEGVADAVNKLLQELVLKCTRDEKNPRDYFHVAVLGYGATVGSAFSGGLAGRELVPISDIANNPSRIEERKKKVEDGTGGLVEESVRIPVWLDAVANGATPMCEVFNRATSIIESWTAQHADSYPPVVINITDGESTDGDPTSAAERIKKTRTHDGETLLYNLHISPAANTPIEFPDSESTLPDQFAQLLFRMSSILPPHIRDLANREGKHVTDGSRAFVFNGDLVSVIEILDIGTRPSNLR